MRRLWLLLALAFTAQAAVAQAQRPLRVGVLVPYTGALAVVGQDVTRGLELALAKAGPRVAGREVQLLKEDSEAKPDVALTKVRKLVEKDQVDFVVGPVQSGEALAMRDYVHNQGVPLIVPVAGTRDLTVPARASTWIFRVSETSDQPNYPMGQWVLKKTPYRKVVVMSSEFVGARQQVEAFMASFKAGGGQVVREVYAPLGVADFAPYLTRITDIGADAVYAFFGGADAIRFVKTYAEFGLDRKMPLLGANALVDDTLLGGMGDAALGIVSVGHYSAALDTPDSRAFVREYEGRHGGWPTRHSENGYVAGQLIVAAVSALGERSTDRARVQEALRAAVVQVKAPRGPMQFDRYQQAVMAQYVMKVARQGNRLVNSIVDQIPAVSQEDTWKWWNK